MKYFKRFFNLTIMSIFCISALNGQQSVTATGGDAASGIGSVSYSIGQILSQTISNTTGTVNQGVQQPKEYYSITSAGIIAENKTVCFIYPNPTNGLIKLVIENPCYAKFRFRLYSINGLLLQDKEIETSETEISLFNQSGSIYFLKVIKNKKEIQLFRIIKI